VCRWGSVLRRVPPAVAEILFLWLVVSVPGIVAVLFGSSVGGSLAWAVAAVAAGILIW
jgi:hypothetical protein